MSSLTEVTLQLIHKKLDEILAAIGAGAARYPHYQMKEKPITQEQFNRAMKEVMDLVNKGKP